MDMNELLSTLKEQSEAIQSLANAVNTKEKNHEKTAANTSTGFTILQPNGIFGTAGLDREVITAHTRPVGIGSILPMIPSVYEDPRFPSITGFTDTEGTQPDNVCQDAPYGFMKGCMLTARFAPLRFDTNTIDVTKTIKKLNQGVTTDLMLRGRLLSDMNLSPRNMTEQDVLQLVTKAEMVGVGVQFERTLSQWIWQGTIAAGQFPGLDVQIATGQKDAETGTLCPALDSDIKDFNYDLVGGTGRDIVEYLSMLEFYLRTNASRMGLDPVTWVVTMRPELWFELSAEWPCSYLSHRCTTGDGSTSPMVINDNVNVKMRDDMRNGMYIDINGNRYPVIVDSGIDEENNITNGNLAAGEYASSIYFVPITSGGMNVTYREYLDYTLTEREAAMLNGMQTFWTDGGIYTWAIENNKWCYKLSGLTEQRVVLRTPQLAGKIQNVKYSPLQHLRDPYPEDPYFMDGGVSLRGFSLGEAVWDTRQ